MSSEPYLFIKDRLGPFPGEGAPARRAALLAVGARERGEPSDTPGARLGGAA